MKTLVLSCGSGVATSTVVAGKVKDFLDANGFEGQYTITQCAIAEAPSKSANADAVIATTAEPAGLECPYIAGLPFLMGVGQGASEEKLLEIMKA